MKIPVWLLRLLPMWDYICPKCKKNVEKNSHRCPYCGEQYGNPVRVQPKLLKHPKALEDYVHKHVFPRVSKAQREYLARFFTELFSDGFESGDTSAWDGINTTNGGTVSVVDTVFYHGSYSCKATVLYPASHASVYKDFTGQDEVYTRGYFMFSALPDSNNEDIWFMEILVSGNEVAKVSIYHDGSNLKLRVYNFAASESYYSDVLSFSVDTWYCAELHLVRNSTSGVLEVWLNGVKKIEQNGINTDIGQYNKFRVGHIYSDVASDVYVDCVVVADTYIGPEVETYTKTWTADTLFKKLGITRSLAADATFQKQGIPKTFGLDVIFEPVEAETHAKNFALDVIFAYKVRLPELWLEENGKLVLNISKPYTWVGT